MQAWERAKERRRWRERERERQRHCLMAFVDAMRIKVHDVSVTEQPILLMSS